MIMYLNVNCMNERMGVHALRSLLLLFFLFFLFSSSFIFLSAHSTTQTHHRERISVSLAIVLRKCERRSHTRTCTYVREHTRPFLAKRFSSVAGADNKILILLLKRHNSLPMIFIRSMNFPVDFLSEA